MPMADVCHGYLHARGSWPPGSGQLLLKDDLRSTYSTWSEQCQQGHLTAERFLQSMASPKSFALTMTHNMWVPSSPASVYLGASHTKPQVCITHSPMDLPRHSLSLSNMHSNEPNTVVLTHSSPCQHSKLHPSTPSFHLQQSYCTNTNSEQPFQPRYPTATHQPYKSVSRLTHALKLLKHRLTNIAKHLHHCMLVNQLQCMTPSEGFGFLLLW